MKEKKYLLKNILFSSTFMVIFFSCLLGSFCSLEIVGKEIGLLVDYASVLLCFIIIVLYIFNLKFSKFTIFFTFFLITLSISTLFGDDSEITHFIKVYYRILAFVYYFDWASKIDLKKMIDILFRILFILVFINFITIVLFPNGMYKAEYSNNWFLGYDNTHIFVFLPTLVLGLIRKRMEIKNSKIDLYAVLIFITYCVYFCMSANSVVAYTLFLLYLVFEKILNRFKFITLRNLFIIFLILFLLFVILRIQYLFSWLIVDILNKDLTFTNRTIIWDNVLECVKDNYILGFGVENPTLIAQKLGKSHFSHAHNTILDILYKGGIISIFTFLFFINTIIEKMEKLRKNHITKLLSVVIFCMLIMMLFEAREDVLGLYIILILAFKVDKIINLIEKNGE